MSKQVTRNLFAATAFAILAAGAFTVPAHGAESGDLVLRFGGHVVVPQSGNGTLAGQEADISNSFRPSFSLEYMLTRHWGVDILGAWPFAHEVELNGTKVAEVNVLPPIVGVNYHFLTDSRFSPFVGLGVNFTYFYDAEGHGPLDGKDISVESSWGAAAHLGVDIDLPGNWLLTVDARWADIEADVKVNGAVVGTAEVDPWVYGLSLGYAF